MKTILTHISAFEFWRSPLAISAKPTRMSTGKLCATSFAHAQDSSFPIETMSKPICLLVNSKDARRKSKDIVCRYYPKGLPRNSLYCLNENSLVVCPELSFVQMASHLSLPHLIQYGMELCSCYSIDAGGGSIIPHKPFCTEASLARAIQRYPLKNCKKAEQALRWVAEGSASPRETQVYLLMCLPNRLGGYGIPKAKLNYRVNLPEELSLTLGKRYLLCDMYWPDALLDVEYDSNAFHVGETRIEQDSLRRNALGHLGIRSVTLTNHQVTNGAMFQQFVQQIAKAVGFRLQANPQTFSRKHASLRDDLFIHTLDDLLA